MKAAGPGAGCWAPTGDTSSSTASNARDQRGIGCLAYDRIFPELTDDRIFVEDGADENRVLSRRRRGVVAVQLQRQLQIGRLVARERHRIHAGVARGAVLRAAAVDRSRQPLETEIADA